MPLQDGDDPIDTEDVPASARKLENVGIHADDADIFRCHLWGKSLRFTRIDRCFASVASEGVCESVDSYQKLYTLSHMTTTDRDRLLKLARERAVITAAGVARAGIHSQQITRLVAGGVLERISRGQYRLAERPVTEHHGLVVAARAVPNGVICLLSALDFHAIGTQLPPEVWVAIERGTRAPPARQLPLAIVRFSGNAFTEGIEIYRIEGERVRVYSVAKTLADLFKHRHKVGLEVALEALREAWLDRRFTMEALDRAAQVCRVERVMRPYVEAMVS